MIDTEPIFLRFRPGGTLHVFREHRRWCTSLGDGATVDVGSLLACQAALCGVTGKPSQQYWATRRSEDDDKLCRRCVDLWPHEKVLLFPTDEVICG